jgi:hypothetical protein
MNMPPVQFQSNVHYRNDIPLPLSSYPHIRVPPGVSARTPFFISADQMQRLAPARTIKVVAGLTTAEFSLRFATPAQQWRQVRSGGALARWQFQGGAVIFDVLITVYVADGFRPYPKSVAIILEHEFLHVQDDIDIISRFMTAAAPQDQYVQRYLCQGTEVDESMYRQWFAGAGFQNWVRDGVWLPERNRREATRDSGAEWANFRRRIDELQQASH